MVVPGARACSNLNLSSARFAANYMRRKQAEDRRSINSSVMSNADHFDGAPSIVPVRTCTAQSHARRALECGMSSQSRSLTCLLRSLGSQVELGPGCCRTGWCSFKYGQFQRWFTSKTRWDALGAVFFVLGNIANFVSLGFAPQSMLAACGSVQFATNVFCELYFKGQAITGRVLKATCVILTGNALIVAFASHESPQLNVDELLSAALHTRAGACMPETPYKLLMFVPLSPLFAGPVGYTSSLPTTCIV